MRGKYLLPLLLLLLVCAICQSAKKQAKAKPADESFLMSIVNTVLGGPYDAPILTRLMNKISHIGTVLLGSLFAYFKWFRQRKNRREKINEYIGEEKHQFALTVESEAALLGEHEAEHITYDLNSEKTRMMALRSNNNSINFNIEVAVEEVLEESLLIYHLTMRGTDPEGRSTFTGFLTFKDRLLEMRLEQTYEKGEGNKKDDRPICLFAGRQSRVGEKLVQGEWWIENQRNTQGSHCGTWTFTY
jgi:hypothetical protein